MTGSLKHGVLFDVSYYHYARAWRALQQNDLLQARLYIEHALKLTIECEVYFSEALCHLLKAQVCHESGEDQEAMECIVNARRIGATMKSSLFEYMCLLAEAQFALDGKQRGRLGEAERTQQEDLDDVAWTNQFVHATQCLHKAMVIGREKGFMYHHGWRPHVMVQLCQKALEDGIEAEYVQRLIRTCKLTPQVSGVVCENWPYPIKIFTLGQFDLLKDDNTRKPSRKIQQKPLHMLKLIIAFGGEEIAEEQISDQLWPEADGDLAHESFKTTLFRLRNLLEEPNAIRLREGRLSLNFRYCWVDVWAFERLCERVDGHFHVPEIETMHKGVTPFLPSRKPDKNRLANTVYPVHGFSTDGTQKSPAHNAEWQKPFI